MSPLSEQDRAEVDVGNVERHSDCEERLGQIQNLQKDRYEVVDIHTARFQSLSSRSVYAYLYQSKYDEHIRM